MRELREIRLRRGLSQADLSAMTGVAEFTISEIESGKRTNPRPSTLRKLAQALEVEVTDLYGNPERPLGEAPPSQQLTLNGELEEERHVQHLRALRAIVHGLAHRWETEPPKTSREIAPLYDALTAVVEQGVFEPSDVSRAEAFELHLLMVGFQRLNDVADKVLQIEKEEEAQQRRAKFALIQEQRSA